MSDCLFCKIANNEIPSTRVYDDEHVFAMMDIFPESRGHLLVIPKSHATDIFGMGDDILAHVVAVSKKLAVAAKTAFNADGIKIAQFNGASAGQTVFHYHMHVVPAFEGVSFQRHAGEPADVNELGCLANAIKGYL